MGGRHDLGSGAAVAAAAGPAMGRTLGWLGLPLLSGLLWWAAFPPLDLFLLAWVAPVPLAVFSLGESSRRRRWGASTLAGTASMTAAFYWTAHVAPVGPWLLALYLGLYFPLFGGTVRLLVTRLGMAPLLAVPVAWIAADQLRGTLFSGLPYYLLGHSQVAWLGLCQAADLGGVHLVSAVPLATAGWLTGLVVRAPTAGWGAAFREARAAGAAAGLLAAAAAGYGAWRLHTLELIEGPLVGLVQPNIRQDNKVLARIHSTAEGSRRYREEIHARMIEMTAELMEAHAARPPDLVVWPETAWLGAICIDPENPEEIWTDHPINYLRGRAPAHLLFGCERYDARKGSSRAEGKGPYVSSVLVDGQSRVLGIYDKVHLVPFGEYIPLEEVPAVKGLYEKISRLSPVRFQAGEAPRVMSMGGRRFGTAICFEAIFPEIARAQAAEGAEFIMNLSNEGWFGESVELELMDGISRFRAIENRRAFVRATNTGISGFILPTGETEAAVADASGRRDNIAGTLVRSVRTMGGATVYRTVGEALPLGCLGFVGLAAGSVAFRRLRAVRN